VPKSQPKFGSSGLSLDPSYMHQHVARDNKILPLQKKKKKKERKNERKKESLNQSNLRKKKKKALSHETRESYHLPRLVQYPTTYF